MAAKRGKSSSDGDTGVDPEELYNEFPSGETIGFGRDAGYGELVQINDRKWFTEDAQRRPGDQGIHRGVRERQRGIQLSPAEEQHPRVRVVHPQAALAPCRRAESRGIVGSRAGFARRPAHRDLRHQPSPHAGASPDLRDGGQRRHRSRARSSTRETAPRAGIRSCAVRRASTRTLRSHATAPPAAPPGRDLPALPRAGRPRARASASPAAGRSSDAGAGPVRGRAR